MYFNKKIWSSKFVKLLKNNFYYKACYFYKKKFYIFILNIIMLNITSIDKLSTQYFNFI